MILNNLNPLLKPRAGKLELSTFLRACLQKYDLKLSSLPKIKCNEVEVVFHLKSIKLEDYDYSTIGCKVESPIPFFALYNVKYENSEFVSWTLNCEQYILLIGKFDRKSGKIEETKIVYSSNGDSELFDEAMQKWALHKNENKTKFKF